VRPTETLHAFRDGRFQFDEKRDLLQVVSLSLWRANFPTLRRSLWDELTKCGSGYLCHIDKFMYS